MTRVDFYLACNGTGREPLACRLADTAYRRGHKIFLWTPEAQIGGLDALLWTFSDTSFIPHAPSIALSDEPVVIGSQIPAEGDVLIPLFADPPSTWSQFARILEPVGDSEAEKEASRERFRYYRRQGLHPTVHTLS